MPSNTWARLDEVFFQALELPLAERASFLDRACGGDAAFRREVEAVLAGHDAAGGTVDSDRLLSPVTVDGIGSLPAGARIGAYAIEAVLGRGGMGEVYRARRADAQYEQQVAIKLMRPGRDTVDLMRRFRTERQILARLQHPNIATLLDGGITEQGQPYLVMQYVDGTSLTAHANDRELDLGQRLRLFVTVCDAVQFAHANLVVHRDLKPTNILVTSQGEVRLLDFGIAKLLDPATDGSSTGDLLLLTPEHAAPEQFLGATVTTATDVYGLGILLYEMLTGSRPFQFVPRAELHRAVCEQEPNPPSAVAADATWLERAKLARSPVTIDGIVGDLDAIVLKALRKEPERRYASAAELAADVRRHLNGFPVLARPETFRYVAGRYLRRHKVGVAASLALATALIALAVVSVRFGVTSRAQAQAVAEERDVAVRVSNFLESLFRAPQPFATGPGRRDTMRIRDFLIEGAAKIRTDLEDQPAVQARLLRVLGSAQADLGNLDLSQQLLEEAVAINRRVFGPAAPVTATSERSLSSTLWQRGKYAQAESLARQASSSLAADSVDSRVEWIKSISALGNSLASQGRLPEAEPVYRQALALAQANPGPTDPDFPSRLSDLGTIVGMLGRTVEAESLMRRAIELERSNNGSDHPRVATPLGNLGSQLIRQNRFADAEPLLREALAIQRKRLPSPHPRIASTIGNLGVAVLRQQRPAEAESLFRQAMAMNHSLHGDKHPTLAANLLNIAGALEDLRKPAEAMASRREALAMIVATAGPDHPTTATAYQNIGVADHLAGRHHEALAGFTAAIAIRKKRLPPGDEQIAVVLSKAGLCLLELKQYAEAEARFKESFALYEKLQPKEGEQRKRLLGQMAQLYRTTGRATEASRFQTLADSVTVMPRK